MLQVDYGYIRVIFIKISKIDTKSLKLAKCHKIVSIRKIGKIDLESLRLPKLTQNLQNWQN